MYILVQIINKPKKNRRYVSTIDLYVGIYVYKYT